MKFVVSSAALYGRIQTSSKVINSKNPLPILDCFLFEIQDKSLTIQAADSEIRLITTMEIIESSENFSFCINAKTILDSLKEIPEQPITFDIDPQNMEINILYQNGHFSIVGQSSAEYPCFPEVIFENQLNIPAEALLKGINYSFFATADDELRPIMNGIYLDITTDDVTFVASDGQKLVRNKILNAHGNTNSAFILPKKPASILKNILAKENDEVTIQYNSRGMYAQMGEHSLYCQLIEGRYPNYNMVIPKNNPYSVTIDRLRLLGVIKRVLIFSSQSSSLIKLSLENNKMVITGQDLDYSTYAEEHIACAYSGTPFKIGFNGNYLYDILNNLNSSDVTIELADPSRAGVILPSEQEENEDTLMLLVPLMLND